MQAPRFIRWRKTPNGKLVFTCTEEALMVGIVHFDVPGFIPYLQDEVKRLDRICVKMFDSPRLNLDKAMKLGVKLQLHRECLLKAYACRRHNLNINPGGDVVKS